VYWTAFAKPKNPAHNTPFVPTDRGKSICANDRI